MAIRLVVPVSQADFHQLDGWMSVYRALGGTPKHPITFIPVPSLAALTEQAASSIGSLAAEVKILPLHLDFIKPWPHGPNEHFYWSIFRLFTPRHGIENKLPWLWCELDALPMVHGWLDQLEVEYMMTFQQNPGYLGIVRPMPKPMGQGRIIRDPNDPYMTGVCIYPPDFTAQTDGQWRSLITQVVFRDEPTDGRGGVTPTVQPAVEPWDQMLRNYMRKHWAQSHLMDDRWRTLNYREVGGGRIICDSAPNNPFGADLSGEINPRAVLVHGCKDESLARLILARNGATLGSISQLPVVKPVCAQSQPDARPTLPNQPQAAFTSSPPPRQEAPPPLNDGKPPIPVYNGAGSSGFDSGAGDFQRLLAQEQEAERIKVAEHQQKVQQANQTLGSPAQVQVVQAPPPVPDQSLVPAVYQIKDFLSGKRNTAKQIAKSLNLTAEKVKEIVESSGGVLKLSPGQAGWISATV